MTGGGAVLTEGGYIIENSFSQGEKVGMTGGFLGNGDASIPTDNLPPHPTSPSGRGEIKKILL